MGLFFNYDSPTGEFSRKESREEKLKGLMQGYDKVTTEGTMKSFNYDENGNETENYMQAPNAPIVSREGGYMSSQKTPEDLAMLAGGLASANFTPVEQRTILQPMIDERSAYAELMMQENRIEAGIGQPQDPSAVREFQYFQGLDPAKQQAYLDVKRGGYKIIDVNGIPTRVPLNSIEGSGVGMEALTTLEGEAEGQATIEGAKSGQKTKSAGRMTRLNTQINNGMAAADGMAVLNRGIELLDDGIATGGYDNMQLWVKQRLGVESADEGELSNLMGKAILAQLRETFGAAFTAKEGDSLKQIEANFGKSPSANRRLLQNALAIAKRSANRGLDAATSLEDEMAIKQLNEAMGFELPAGTKPTGGVSPSGIKYTVK